MIKEHLQELQSTENDLQLNDYRLANLMVKSIHKLANVMI